MYYARESPMQATLSHFKLAEYHIEMLSVGLVFFFYFRVNVIVLIRVTRFMFWTFGSGNF